MIGALIRGDDNVLKVEVAQDGQPVDISGDQITFTVKVNKTDVDASAVFQLRDTIVSTVDSQAGIHRIQIPNTIPIGTYHYDVQWRRFKSGNSGIITLEIGTFSVVQDVTITA